MTKTCSICLIEKDLSNFYIKVKKTGQLDSRCKICFNELRKERRKKKKYLIKSLMSNICQECGFDDKRCLNNYLGKGRAKALLHLKDETIENEIKNSLVLCCNCVAIKLYQKNKERIKNIELSKKKATIQTRKRRKDIQKYIDDIKKNGCNKCKLKNEQYLCIFHFDHIYKKYKVNGVGKLAKDSLQRVKEEMKYCQLLCANCHEIKTLEENDSLTKVEKIRKLKDNRKKLTDEVINKVKELLLKNIPKTQIAKQLNISRESIYNILKK